MIIDEGPSSGSSDEDEDEAFDWEVVPDIGAQKPKRRDKKAPSYAAVARLSAAK